MKNLILTGKRCRDKTGVLVQYVIKASREPIGPPKGNIKAVFSHQTIHHLEFGPR
jgi:hypothetical protein